MTTVTGILLGQAVDWDMPCRLAMKLLCREPMTAECMMPRAAASPVELLSTAILKDLMLPRA